MDDSLTNEEIIKELDKLRYHRYYGFITFKFKAGEVMPIIDLKRSKKIKPKNGGFYNAGD